MMQPFFLNICHLKKNYIMKKQLWMLLMPVLFCGCFKTGASEDPCTNATPASEESQLIAFCNSNGITPYVKDPSGIYYQVIEHGTGAPPTVNSTITYTYTAKYLNGTVLDQATTAVTNKLGILIQGFQIMLPNLAKGGRIKMVIPSSLCYGCNGVPGRVPPNTPIYFDLSLVDVI